MRSQALLVCFLLVLSSNALGQSYEMTIHLSNGDTIVIPHDEVQRIEFTNVTTGAEGPTDPENVAHMFWWLRNYPNPFNPLTTIEYDIPIMADVAVRVFDLKGGLIRELLHEIQDVGLHQVTWDGTESSGVKVSSGVYFCVVECGELTLTQRLILVK